jgi:hypothetical protein
MVKNLTQGAVILAFLAVKNVCKQTTPYLKIQSAKAAKPAWTSMHFTLL